MGRRSERGVAMHFQQVQEIPPDPTAKINIFDVKKYILSLSPAHSYPLFQVSNVKRLMQLILVMPATNASSERSFSALRRLKTYLRTTMKQDHLNYLMLLHVHKDKTDDQDLKVIVNEFINSEHRFAKLE